MDSEKPASAGQVVLTSFLVDCLDVVFSLLIAVVTGSVIMISETLEGLTDLIASGFLMIGLESSKRNPDPTHPFGYGREIYFWTLISALVMFGISATMSFYLGWQRFLKPVGVHNIYAALGILFLTLITNSYAFLVSFKRLLRSRSPSRIIAIFFRSSLVETKTTFILDLMGMLASFLGILSLGVYLLTGDQRLDGLGAMVIGVTLAFFAYLLIMGIRDLLVGRSASPEVEDRIKKATQQVKEVTGVLGLKTMHIGSERLLVNIDVNLNAQLTTRQIERLIDDIKQQVKKEVPSVKHIQVELESRD